jgi:uncharacterized protein YigA (DUF484 family)
VPSEPHSADADLEGRRSAAEVRAYLRRNPDFLSQNPDLLATLTPPDARHGDQVVDLQNYMIERLQGEMARLKSYQGELIAASRTNMASQGQVHTAVLALLRARDLGHLVSIVTSDFLSLLELEAVALCVEEGGAETALTAQDSVRAVPRGVIDGTIGEGRDILLRAGITGEKAIFGAAGEAVRSDALVRLRLRDNGPAALLALGAAEEEKFHPGQGTELISFMAKSLEYCVGAWLIRPK